jgi:tetratricopeptide (TPR) repeat protein
MAGRPAEAQTAIERSLTLRPRHVPSLLVAARTCLALKRPGEAVPLLREVVAQAPALADAAFLLCGALIELRDPSLGATIEQTARLHRTAAADWQRLGLALQRAGLADLALQAFTLAAEADPSMADAHFGRGLVLRDAGVMQEALAALQRATTLHPGASGAWFALGLTCQDLSDEAGAVAAFRAALQARPNFAEAAVNLGIALQRTGDMEAALAAYREAVRIRPETFARIAQAVTAASTGTLWLDIVAFRRVLTETRPPGAKLAAIDSGAA